MTMKDNLSFLVSVLTYILPPLAHSFHESVLGKDKGPQGLRWLSWQHALLHYKGLAICFDNTWQNIVNCHVNLGTLIRSHFGHTFVSSTINSDLNTRRTPGPVPQCHTGFICHVTFYTLVKFWNWLLRHHLHVREI